ncbi:MAG: hypothetical protein IKY82_01050 [Alistipes sp.]|nr:hypothetical protein [Alistipes sp.]
MRKIVYVCLLLCLPAVVSAQVAKQVEVSKDYTPSVSTAQKLSIVPDMTDTVKMYPDIDYTITPRSYQTSLLVENFKPATITYWDYAAHDVVYAKAAAGVPLASEADVYVSTYNKDKGYAMAYINHLGDYRSRYALNGVDKVTSHTTEMDNRVGGRAGLFWGRRVLEADVAYDNVLRHRYPTTGDRIMFGRLDGKVRLGDDFTDLSRWNFNLEVGGGLFTDATDKVEVGKYCQSFLEASAALGKQLGRHLFRVDVAFDGVYGDKALADYYDNIFKAGALYGIEGKRFEFKLGAYYLYDRVSHSTDSPHHILPYMRMSWKNTREGFVPFVEFEGDMERHDFVSLIYANPYLKSDDVTLAETISKLPNETSYNGRAGFGGTLGKGVFSYSLSAELELADNHIYWYCDNADYLITTAYQHSLRIDGSMKLRPAGWFETETAFGVYVWENYDSHYASRPNFEWAMDLRYLGRKISAGVNLGYRGGVKWMTKDASTDEFSFVKTPNTFTLGVEAEWRINSHWAVFAEGRNLTGSTLYDWLYYYSNTPEGLLGVKLTF